jgi:hypothetical protein
MLILEAGEVCPFGNRCPYNSNGLTGPCQGTLSSRQNKFTCEYVQNGKIVEGGSTRLSDDKTGNMKIIME